MSTAITTTDQPREQVIDLLRAADALLGGSKANDRQIREIRQQMFEAVAGPDAGPVRGLPMLKIGRMLATIAEANYCNDPKMEDRSIVADADFIVRWITDRS